MRTFLKPISKHGFTLTELAIVLGVFGAVLGSIWVSYNQMSASSKVEQAAQEILTISQAERSFFGNQSVIDANLIGTEITPIMVSDGVIPQGMPMVPTTDPNWHTQTRPINPWGGYISSYAMSATTFRVSFYGLPIAACVQLETQIASQTGRAAPVGVGSWFTNTNGASYGADNYMTLPPTSGGATVPFTPAMAEQICGGNSSGGDPSTDGNVSAEFDFSIN